MKGAQSAKKDKYMVIVVKGEQGGAQVVAVNEAITFKKKGSDVIIVTGPVGTFVQNESQKNDLSYIQVPSLRRSYNPLNALFSFFDIRKIIKDVEPTYIHLHSSNSLFAAIAAKSVRKKPHIIFTFHGLSFLDPGHEQSSIKRSILRLIFSFLLRFVDEAIAITQSNYDFIVAEKLIASSRLVLSPVSPGNIDYLSREAARSELSSLLDFDLKDKYVIGTIGRLAYPKNQQALIPLTKEISKEKSNIVTLIIGDGPDRKNIEELIEKNSLSDRIFLLGEIAGASKLLKAFDLFVLPSLYEGRSLSLMEARNADIPILASDIPGNREVLEGYESTTFRIFSSTIIDK